MIGGKTRLSSFYEKQCPKNVLHYKDLSMENKQAQKYWARGKSFQLSHGVPDRFSDTACDSWTWSWVEAAAMISASEL